jgi:hypothetical protein
VITPYASYPYLDLHLFKGASLGLEFEVRRINSLDQDVVFPLNGYNVRMIVEDILTKSSTIPYDGVTISNPTLGLGVVRLYPSDTSLFYDGVGYRIEAFDLVNIYPFLYGTIKLLTSVV